MITTFSLASSWDAWLRHVRTHHTKTSGCAESMYCEDPTLEAAMMMTARALAEEREAWAEAVRLSGELSAGGD